MSARDTTLAALTSVIWGLGFAAGKLGLESFAPAQLTTARFVIACLPVLVVPRPRVAWSSMVAIGLTLFTGQFLLMFLAFDHGLPPGVASVTQQMQAFFTVGLAAPLLGDVPTRRQTAGMLVALAGLGLIASTTGADLRFTGLALGLGAAFSWAVGNVLLKRLREVPVLSLVVWCSLVPPLPAMLVSHFTEPAGGLPAAVLRASWVSLGAIVYLGGLATVVAYAVWGSLLRRYPAGAVAPFALLAPCAGIVSCALIFGEVPGPVRWAGMALILAGLAIVVLAPLRDPVSPGDRARAFDAGSRRGV